MHDLLDIEGPDFVRFAYVTLLCRKLDPSGRKSAEDFLRRGGRKIDLVASIATSDEARRLSADLSGLNRMLQRRALGRLPLLGWLLRPLLGLEPMDAAARRERAIAFALAQSHEAMSVQLLRVESLIAAVSDPMDGPGPADRFKGTSVRSRQIMHAMLARLS
ncbi:hypothetical protein [Novosphingobium resinovorum]|uniref:hypothetical protein n=1 Tax=Novosphingobium resinovorum TaxID=158500 RepID=UPI002ED05789|nr:hypothetical protein [Novosphingobium resinovorum]